MPHSSNKTQTLIKDISIIFGGTLFISIISILFNLDEKIVPIINNGTHALSWQARQYGAWLPMAISILALIFLLIAPIRLKFPTVRQVAIIWLIALILGGGLLTHVFGKELFERPRPRETVLLGGMQKYSLPIITTNTEIKGNSFASGHAAAAIMMAVPFFPLRRKKPKLAKTFLIVGGAYGIAIGASRMILGAHFLTDILWAFAFVLGTAAIADRFISSKTDIKTRYLAPFIIFIIIGVALFNKFTMELNLVSKNNNIILDIPCKKAILQDGSNLNIKIELSGYGAPLSLLKLNENKNTIKLQRWRGIYRNLNCTAYIQLPIGKSVSFLEKVSIKNPHNYTQIVNKHYFTYKNVQK